LPDDVTTVVGDATHVDDVVRAMAGADATMFCVNRDPRTMFVVGELIRPRSRLSSWPTSAPES
jgi:hypothetical protein